MGCLTSRTRCNRSLNCLPSPPLSDHPISPCNPPPPPSPKCTNLLLTLLQVYSDYGWGLRGGRHRLLLRVLEQISNHICDFFLLLQCSTGWRAFRLAWTLCFCFLEFLAISYSSPKAVTNVLSSVKFHHARFACDRSVFDHVCVRLAVRSLPFTMWAHVSPAPLFPLRLLRLLGLASQAFGRWALPFTALVVFAFYTFARLSSLVPPSAGAFNSSRWPTLADLTVGGEWATLQLKYSKTRQAADGGFLVPLRVSQALPCPVRLARRLLRRAKHLGLPLSAPLFTGGEGRGEHLGAFLVQPQARELLKRGLVALGLAPTAFSFHSFRRGGCSLAFERGAVESDLALHGDWRSAAIRDYYPARLARQIVIITQITYDYVRHITIRCSTMYDNVRQCTTMYANIRQKILPYDRILVAPKSFTCKTFF